MAREKLFMGIVIGFLIAFLALSFIFKILPDNKYEEKDFEGVWVYHFEEKGLIIYTDEINDCTISVDESGKYKEFGDIECLKNLRLAVVIKESQNTQK